MKARGSREEWLEDHVEMGQDDLGMEGFPAKHLRWESCEESDGFVAGIVAGRKCEVYSS